MTKWAQWIATCGPIGHLKYAPGTWGSLCGIFAVWLFRNHPSFFIFLSGFIFCVAVWASFWASKELNDKDPSVVVIDEVCGVMVSFLLVPVSWVSLLVGFCAFRFFDIVKPQPVRYLERFPNGFGIVLDDVMAGIYANFLLQLLMRYAHL